jgi:hypothetical protein
LLAAFLAAHCQTGKTQTKAPHGDSAQPGAPVDDICGIYSFLGEGEFLQINRDENGLTGYISRLGTQESDHGAFLDQFFSSVSVQGHDVTFATKVVHGVWYEFKGRYERGPAQTKAQDGYYVLRGTLTEFTGSEDKSSSTSRDRQVEFRWMAEPQDVDVKGAKGTPKKK